MGPIITSAIVEGLTCWRRSQRPGYPRPTEHSRLSSQLQGFAVSGAIKQPLPSWLHARSPSLQSPAFPRHPPAHPPHCIVRFCSPEEEGDLPEVTQRNWICTRFFDSEPSALPSTRKLSQLISRASRVLVQRRAPGGPYGDLNGGLAEGRGGGNGWGSESWAVVMSDSIRQRRAPD